MIGTKKIPTNAGAIPAALAFGTLLSLVITVSGTGILAKLVGSELLEEQSTGYGIMVILILAAYAGSLMSTQKAGRQRLIVCVSTGAVYFGILLCITALFFEGEYSGVGVKCLLILCGSLLAAIPLSKGNNRGKIRKIKIANR